jgi:hypothetical protein
MFKLATKVEKQIKEKEVRKTASFGGSRVLNRGYPISRGSSTQSAKPTSSAVAKFLAKQLRDPLNQPLKLFNAIGAKGTVT